MTIRAGLLPSDVKTFAFVETAISCRTGAPQLPSTSPVVAFGALRSLNTPQAGPACAESSGSHAPRLTARTVYQTLLGFALVNAPGELSRK